MTKFSCVLEAGGSAALLTGLLVLCLLPSPVTATRWWSRLSWQLSSAWYICIHLLGPVQPWKFPVKTRTCETAVSIGKGAHTAQRVPCHQGRQQQVFAHTITGTQRPMSLIRSPGHCGVAPGRAGQLDTHSQPFLSTLSLPRGLWPCQDVPLP